MSTGSDQGGRASVPGQDETCGPSPEQRNRPEDVNLVVFEVRTAVI